VQALKKEVVIVKLDFDNAFDMVEHHLLIDMLKSKGFGQRWIKWISNILSTRTSSVLQNVVHVWVS
jgi:hypothetical protein